MCTSSYGEEGSWCDSKLGYHFQGISSFSRAARLHREGGWSKATIPYHLPHVSTQFLFRKQAGGLQVSGEAPFRSDSQAARRASAKRNIVGATPTLTSTVIKVNAGQCRCIGYMLKAIAIVNILLESAVAGVPPIQRACANCEKEHGILNRSNLNKSHGQCRRHFLAQAAELRQMGMDSTADEIEKMSAKMPNSDFCPDLGSVAERI